MQGDLEAMFVGTDKMMLKASADLLTKALPRPEQEGAACLGAKVLGS